MTSILIIGAGKFGQYIAMELSEMDTQIMAVDSRENLVNEIMPYVENAQIGDATNPEFLKGLGIPDFDVCIVAIGDNFQNSLETTLALKELGAKKVVSRASSDVHAKFLTRNGADEILYPERQMARWAAVRYTSNHIFDYIELDKDHGIFEVEVPKAWLNKTIGTVNVRKNYGFNIMGLKKDNKVDVNINADTVLSKDANLLVVGEFAALEKVFKL